MAAKALPAQDVLLQLLSYNPETGRLYWRTRPVEGFATLRAGRLWNTRFANYEAFTGRHPTGYCVGRVDGQRYKAHRVIWKMVYGTDPEEIDHVNGDRADNRLNNLREVYRLENTRNRAKSAKNSSGVQGVSWHKAAGKWAAKIGIGYRTINLGLFKEFHEAVAARKAAELEYGFHENHGRAA